MNTTGLVRVTVAAPTRRIDLALPERSPIAEILPGLLRHAGDGLADQGAGNGGWSLRRTDGAPLDIGRTLAANRVMDGEILNLTPARTDWPELEYDDLVDAIASGSARAGRTWGPRHTRTAGLALATVAILLGLIAVLRAGPGWLGPALWCLGAATLLNAAGVLQARAISDAGSGSVLAALALPFAFAGGGLLFAGDRPIAELGAPHLLGACAALLLAAVVGIVGVADRTALFTAAATIGLLGVIAGWLTTAGVVPGFGAAGIIAGGGLAFSPLLAVLSIRLAKVPMPVLPRGTGDLLRDDPQPPRSAVYAAVVRADALLTGMVTGLVTAVVPSELLLVGSGKTASLILLGLITVGFGLRARLYPIVPQRTAMLVAAAGGAAFLALGPLMNDPQRLLLVAGPVLLALGALSAFLGLRHSTTKPGPYLGRYAELLEVLIVLAVVPVLVWALGVYAYLRGLAG